MKREDARGSEMNRDDGSGIERKREEGPNSSETRRCKDTQGVLTGRWEVHLQTRRRFKHPLRSEVLPSHANFVLPVNAIPPTRLRGYLPPPSQYHLRLEMASVALPKMFKSAGRGHPWGHCAIMWGILNGYTLPLAVKRSSPAVSLHRSLPTAALAGG
eukprot:7092399-Pyramimonas_sp.AAC.1